MSMCAVRGNLTSSLSSPTTRSDSRGGESVRSCLGGRGVGAGPPPTAPCAPDLGSRCCAGCDEGVGFGGLGVCCPAAPTPVPCAPPFILSSFSLRDWPVVLTEVVTVILSLPER